jgi:signal transduction histidine kinase
MLMLYRSETGELPTNVDECSIRNVFDDICASNQYYCEQRDIELVSDLDEDIFWYFDHELVYLMLNDAVVNALRYGKSHVKLNARTQDIDGHLRLVITIEDDGDGYPPSMLSTHENAMSSFNIQEGRTGLGMYFARMIAFAHENDGLRGEISLSNGGTLGGSVFTVMLP